MDIQMTDTTTVDTDNTVATETTEVSMTLEQALAELNATKAQQEKTAKLVEKLRNQEKQNQQLAKEMAGVDTLKEALLKLQEGSLKESNDWKTKATEAEEKYNQLRNELKNKALDAQLSNALTSANVRDVNTALKLLDKNLVKFSDNDEVDVKTIEDAITALKTSDPILFGVDTPSIKPLHSVNNDTDSGYRNELAAAKSIAEVEKIMRKYKVSA